jgi:CubicO group peptidase (beta-lactamase class C family)
MSTERLRRAHDAVQAQIEAQAISGAVTLVARDGRVVHFEAHGLRDVDSRTPMTKDTIFRLASMTKPVTGVAVLMMVEQGTIRLDDPLSRFIPEFKHMKVAPVRGATGPIPPDCDRACFERLIAQAPVNQAPVDSVPAAREITIRDLLTHTAGLVTVTGLVAQRPVRPWPLTPTDTLASYIPRLAGLPLDFQPGTQWSYSPLAGGEVLGRVVEIASGQSYDRFLKERVFDPLGMKDTFFYVPKDRLSRLVSLYDSTPSGLRPLAERASSSDGAFFGGGANLQSTADDYLRFAQMLANGGILNGQRLLGEKTVRLMVSNQVGEKAGQSRGTGQGFLVGTVEDPDHCWAECLGGKLRPGWYVWHAGMDRSQGEARDDPDDPERAGQ